MRIGNRGGEGALSPRVARLVQERALGGLCQVRRGPASGPFPLGVPSPRGPEPTAVQAAPRGSRGGEAGLERCVWTRPTRDARARLGPSAGNRKAFLNPKPQGKVRAPRCARRLVGSHQLRNSLGFLFAEHRPREPRPRLQGEGQMGTESGSLHRPAHPRSYDAPRRRRTCDLKRVLEKGQERLQQKRGRRLCCAGAGEGGGVRVSARW